tara:strand:+ start:8664 stop:9209 length:546 start_codon:yes stop_codon:yes gene_type:complete
MKNNKIINRLFLTLFVTFSMFAAEVNGDDKKNQSREKSAPRAHTKEAFMDSNDEDGDGIVSKEEFLAIRELSHAEKDLNRDGIVTEAEYVAEWEQRLDKQLAKQREASVKQAYVRYGSLDTDRNNNMTLTEFHVSGLRSFNYYDTNGDGIVTENESKPENRFGDLVESNESKKNNKAKKKN